jgi:hypothetical protein
VYFITKYLNLSCRVTSYIPFHASAGYCLPCAIFLKGVFRADVGLLTAAGVVSVVLQFCIHQRGHVLPLLVVMCWLVCVSYLTSSSPPLEVKATPEQKAIHYLHTVSSLRNKRNSRIR